MQNASASSSHGRTGDNNNNNDSHTRHGDAAGRVTWPAHLFASVLQRLHPGVTIVLDDEAQRVANAFFASLLNTLQQQPSSSSSSLSDESEHSRLHFIGQWRSAMDDLFVQWFREHPSWHHGTLTQQRLFVHVDLDAFFCSVQLVKPQHAALRDRPVAIAAGRYNSDISSCNYVARGYGVRAGMYVREARARCPELVILGYDLAACEAAAKTFYRILFDCFPRTAHMALQVYSIDEAMLATDSNDYDVLCAYCDVVRRELARATGGCTASCGIAPNILLARIATARAKPNGVCVIRHEDVPALMRSLPFSAIHGVGHAVLAKVHRLVKAHEQRERDSGGGGGMGGGGGGVLQLRRTDDDGDDDDDDSSDSSDSEGEGEGDDDKDSVDNDDDDDDDDDDTHRVALTPSPRHAQQQTTTTTPQRLPLPRRFRRHRRRRSMTCAAVQRLSRATLQAALGARAGELFYHWCRGADTRVVVRTGDAHARRAAGKAAVPAAVGCSMNYAVRPTCLDDVWRIAHELLEVVCGKLRRAVASASGLRVTLLERHPLHPRTTEKFLGRGFCLEVHVAVRFAHALGAHEHATMLRALQHAVRPLLVDARDVDDVTRAAQLGLLRDREHGVDGWSVTLPTLRDIVIADVRGMTVQATGLRALDSDDDHRPARKPAEGQLSLAAAFSRAARVQQAKTHNNNNKSNSSNSSEDEDDVVVMTTSKPAQQQQLTSAATTRRSDEATAAEAAVVVVASSDAGAHTSEEEKDAAKTSAVVGGNDNNNNSTRSDDLDDAVVADKAALAAHDEDEDDMLWSLYTMPLTRQKGNDDKDDDDEAAAAATWRLFVQRWQQGCAHACALLDYPRVKAYIRCAALRCAQQQQQQQPRECFAQLLAFAQQRLPAPVAWQ